jgi:hypothetical protein
MSREKSEQVSAAKIAAWGGIAVAVIAAIATITVAIMNKSQKPDATPPSNNFYSTNQNNSNTEASISRANNANRNLQQNSNANQFPKLGETNKNSPSDIIPNTPEQLKRIALDQISQGVSTKDFVFRLNSCTQTGRNLTCEFSIMNQSTADRKLRLYVNHGDHQSKITDGNDDEYIASSAKIGTEEDRRFVDYLLIPKKTVKGWIEFKVASLDLAKVKSLRVECSSNDSNQRWQGYWYADF